MKKTKAPLKDKAPRKAPPKKKFRKKGLIMLHYGDGKGKTTAALGTALRALGRGWNVAMVQFIKGNWKTGELEAAKLFKERFHVYVLGEGFTWDTGLFDRDAAAAEKAWKKCREILHDKEHELVIWDEILYCLKYNFLDLGEVVRELRKKPPGKHVILTGNYAPSALVRIADLVSEMRSHKHPYQKGFMAQPGIDY